MSVSVNNGFNPKPKPIMPPKPELVSERIPATAEELEWLNSCLKRSSGPNGERFYETARLLSPGLMEEMLKLNSFNRPIVENNIKRWQYRIRRNAVGLTNQGVAFNRDGDVGDGQHRLVSHIRENKPLLVDVLFGMDPDAFLYLDQPKIRTVRDNLTMRDKETSVYLGPVARILLHAVPGIAPQELGDRQVIEEYGEGMDESIIEDAIENTRGMWETCTPTIAISAYYLIAYNTGQNTDLINEFFNSIAKGEGLSGLRYELREWLKKNKPTGQSLKSVRTKIRIIGVIIYGWNSFVKGNRSFRRDWDSLNSFPEAL